MVSITIKFAQAEIGSEWSEENKETDHWRSFDDVYPEIKP